jgi:hypothetical protein
MELLLTTLFISIELISVYAYWPQIKLLLEKGARAEGFSIKTWGLWSIAGVIGCLYAIFLNKDPYLIFVVAADTAGIMVIFGLSLQYRLRYLAARKRRMQPIMLLQNQLGLFKQKPSFWAELLK